jgi:MFS family permease
MKRRVLARIAIMTAAAIFQLSNSVLTSLLPIRMSLAGVGGFATSLVATAYSIGFVIGCFRVLRVIRAVGHIRCFAAFAGVMAVTTAMLEISADPAYWFVLRVVQGLCLAGLFTVSESWINEQTPNEVRGSILGIYFVAVTLSLLFGQIFLYVFDGNIDALATIVSSLFALALIPVALTTSTSPPPPNLATVDIRGLWGSFATMIYSIRVAHAHDRTGSRDKASVSSTILLVWSVGGAIGLLTLGEAIEIVGLFGLQGFVGASAGLLASFTAWRMLHRETPTHPTPFVSISETTTVITASDKDVPPSPPVKTT